MVVCAFLENSKQVWDGFRPRVYDGYTAREAIALYREHYGLKHKRGIAIMIGYDFNNIKLWRGSLSKTFSS